MRCDYHIRISLYSHNKIYMRVWLLNFTPLSSRDVIQALALRRAQQMGIELPWYNHRTTDENQGDLPWLDPFSPANAQPEDNAVQSAADCDNHSIIDLLAEKDCNLGESKPPPEEASLEVEESFYSLKSKNVEEQTASVIQVEASSDPYSFNIRDHRISASYSSSDCSYPLEPDDEYPSLQQIETTVQRLPRFSDRQLSPVVSTERILMELDEVELPHTRYGDQELPDAAIDNHTVVSNPSNDYYSALSGMNRNDSGNHLSPASSVLSTEDDLRIIMEPEEPPSDTNSMLKASESILSGHHNERNDFTTSIYIGASQKPNSDNHNGNFDQHYLTIGSEQQGVASSDPYSENETHIFLEFNEVELPHSRHGDQELPTIGAMSYNTVVADPSTDYYSTMSSRHNSGHHMNPELPYSRYYGDQELPDAFVDATSHHTVVADPSTDYYSTMSSRHNSGHHMSPELPYSRHYCDQELPDAAIDNHTVVSNPSTDYCSAISEMSSHDSGNHLSPASSVLSTKDDLRIIMEPEEPPSDTNSMLKASGSTYLSGHHNQRNDFTTSVYIGASQKPNSDNHNGNFDQHYLTIRSEQQGVASSDPYSENETHIFMELNEVELPHSRHYGDQELPDASVDATSHHTVEPDPSTDYYSTMSSRHNSGHHMNPELPYSRHYGDQELPDASIDATSHHTVVADPSTDYYSTMSSRHNSGHHMSPELPYSRYYGDQELPDASVDATSHHTVVADPSTDYYSTMSSRHNSGHHMSPELPYSRYYGDQELPDASVDATSHHTVVADPSTDYYSTMSNRHNSGHHMNPELPYSRHYCDQELPDAAIDNHTVVSNPSTDYCSAISEMSSHDSGNHLSPASSVLSTEDDLRIIMEQEEPPSDTNSMLKASGSILSGHHNQRNDFTTSVYIGASQKPNSDNHNGNFDQHYLTIGSEQQGVASSDPYSFNIGDYRISASYSSSDCSYPLEPDDEYPSLQQVETTVQRLPRFSDHQLSPVVSTERILMELDEVELPHTRYGDQELPDAAIDNHTVVSNPSTDYCSAISEMSSHDSGNHLSPASSVLSAKDDLRIIMEPEEPPSDTNSMLKASGSTYLSSHHNQRNDFTTSVYIGASQKPNSDNHNGNFDQHYLTIGSEQQGVASSDPYSENETHIFMELNEVELPHSRHYGDQELPDASVDATSHHTVEPDPSTDYYSTMSSRHNSGHHMNPELPYSRHYGDQELPDASVDATSHHTVVSDPSTDYYSAVSETSSHDSGNHLSPIGSVLSSEDDVRIIMESEESPDDNNSMLKMSSSTSLFIPRGLSNGPLKSSSSLNSHQRNDSTTTFHSILLVQLSGSSDSEEDKHQRSNDPQLPSPIYEPY